MKKILLSAIFASCFVTANAQQLQAIDFESLSFGNVTTDITGATAGQGQMFLVSNNGTAPTTSTNANVANAQVFNSGGTNLKTLKMEGPDGDKGARLLFQKDVLSTAWAARATGNNTIEVAFDINPGGATTSVNDFGVYILTAAPVRIIAAVEVNAASKVISVTAYGKPEGQANAGDYTYTFGTATNPLKLPADQWSNLKLSYNKTTGEIRIKGPGFPEEGGFIEASTTAAGSEPFIMNITSFSGTTTGTGAVTNTSAAVMHFDNFVVKAIGGTTGKEDFADNSFSVYPNPSNDVVNIENTINALIQDISITDMNGRVVKTMKFNGESSIKLSISDLTTGIYMMNINSDKGSITRKIIKN